MTRIQDGKLVNLKQNEVVDEIIGAAVARVEKRVGSHIIRTVPSEEILLVPMDRQLIVQVLVNLLDNAIRHGGRAAKSNCQRKRKMTRCGLM
jgi:two-component system sensor histidine kinase KdpD